MNQFHLANQKRWQAGAARWADMHERRGTWRQCAEEPSLVFEPEELTHLQMCAGKRVAVLGSGDNLAAFALAGMGAGVTSVDISDNQLAIAQDRAWELNLDIRFVQADVIDLSVLANESYDLVYTGGHVAVWVSDLSAYYREASRILVDNGLMIITEYHPFRRVWRQGADTLQVAYKYYDRGPYTFAYDEDLLTPKTGDFTSYEFHWTLSDMINAVLQAHCQIIDVREFGEHVGEWEGAPMQGLPEMLMIVGQKSVAK